MSKDNWKDRECGSLWLNQGKTTDYYSGFVNINGKKQRIVIYRNNYKNEGTNEADLRIYLHKEKQS